MKRKRFTEKQIISVLNEHEVGARVPDLACRHGVSENAIYRLPGFTPVFRADRSQKAPWLVHVVDLARHLDEQRGPRRNGPQSRARHHSGTTRLPAGRKLLTGLVNSI